jgi:hypothetical protein
VFPIVRLFLLSYLPPPSIFDLRDHAQPLPPPFSIYRHRFHLNLWKIEVLISQLRGTLVFAMFTRLSDDLCDWHVTRAHNCFCFPRFAHAFTSQLPSLVMTGFFFLVLCLPLACLLFNTELKLLTDADHGDGGGYHSTPIVEKEKVQTDRKHMPQECAICEMNLKFLFAIAASP